MVTSTSGKCYADIRVELYNPHPITMLNSIWAPWAEQNVPIFSICFETINHVRILYLRYFESECQFYCMRFYDNIEILVYLDL